MAAFDGGENGWNGESADVGDDARSNRAFAQIASNIQKINQTVQQMDVMVTQLGTVQDSKQVRDRLHALTQSANALSKETSTMVQELAALPNQQRSHRLRCDRLTDDLVNVLNKLQTAQRLARDKESESMKRVRQQQQHEYGSVDEHPPSGVTRMSAGGGMLQVEQNLDLAAVKERQQALSELESDIVDVNQIFKELARIVHDQGELVDSIAHHVETAVIQVNQGASDVSRAVLLQASARRKKICLIVFFIAFILIIALIIFLWKQG